MGHLAVFNHLPIEQREKSWYMPLFQFQGVAEQLLQATSGGLQTRVEPEDGAGPQV